MQLRRFEAVNDTDLYVNAQSRIEVSGLVEVLFPVGTVVAILGKSWKNHVHGDSEEKTLLLKELYLTLGCFLLTGGRGKIATSGRAPEHRNSGTPQFQKYCINTGIPEFRRISQ